MLSSLPDGFQSLIGRLKTASEYITQLLLQEFQSLIGRLKTDTIEDIREGLEKFQSLIGRLKTNCFVYNSEGKFLVSIPYR